MDDRCQPVTAVPAGPGRLWCATCKLFVPVAQAADGKVIRVLDCPRKH